LKPKIQVSQPAYENPAPAPPTFNQITSKAQPTLPKITPLHQQLNWQSSYSQRIKMSPIQSRPATQTHQTQNIEEAELQPEKPKFQTLQ